jgi:alpha-mannosidase
VGSDLEIRRDRVRRLLEQVIWPATHPRSAPLSISISRLFGEPLPPDAASGLAFTPFSVGDTWGGAWSTAWFRATGPIPEEFEGAHVVARLDLGYRGQPGFGGEALVFAHGAGGDLVPRQGVNPKHNTIEISTAAVAGDEVELLVEAASNPAPREGPLEWPMLLPDYDGPSLYRLVRFDLAVEDDAMMAVLYDWTVLLELAEALGLGHRRSAEIIHRLDDIALGVDLHDLAGTIAERGGYWAPLLERPAAAGAHEVTAVGHAHIDSAWLWPTRETRRKCGRTFSSVLRLMERYPELIFVCSQAQQHAWMEDHYPSLFAEMKEQVRAGRLEPVGSMWVEPDTNLPSGESLCRQLVFGKRYFLDRYGVETVDCWLPDAFGYSGNLPQILRAANVRRFLTQKLSWNDLDTFPHHTFWWEGIDGSRVIAHCPPTDTYNGDMTVGQLLGSERKFAQHGVSARSLYAYGFGDGGGGPTSAMLERARRLGDLDPLPRLRLEASRSFFDDLEAQAARREAEREAAATAGSSPTAHAGGEGGLPVWSGEMYFERHRGVQTTQARGKLGNRRCENLLREAELWAALGLAEAAATSGASRLEHAWRTLLLHQFHDILPGSSIHWVHDDALAAHADVAAIASEVIGEATGAMAAGVGLPREPPDGYLGSVLVLNPATGERREVASVDIAAADMLEVPAAAVDAEGRVRPVQDAGNGIVRVPVQVAGSGWGRLDFVAGTPTGVAIEHPVEVSARRLSNGLVSLTLDEDGLVTSLDDLVTGREILEAGLRGNLFQLHHDLPSHFDAWDVDLHTFDRAYDQVGGASIEVIEEGLVRGAIRVVRPIGRASSLTQEIRLDAGSRRVEFVTEVEWEERHRFLKVAFPVAVRSQHAIYEIQFGHLERPTHANTSWDVARFEVPAQRWAALADADFGVALLNDCKYGYDIRGNVMRLSLLRGPGWPDPEADVGRHRFSYAVLPFGGIGDLREVVSAAEAFNLPFRVVAARSPQSSTKALPPAGQVLGLEGAMLGSVKRADDGSGDLVVRLYEHAGSYSRATLSGLPVARASRVDLLERHVEDVVEARGEVCLDLRPFELVTLRLALGGELGTQPFVAGRATSR